MRNPKPDFDIGNALQEKYEKARDPIQLIDAATWLDTDPPKPDQILEGVFDTSDKFVIIASSKLRKSFFLLMMALCLAAGKPFLAWGVPKKRRVVIIQLEIKTHHFHRRVKKMARALGIGAQDIGGRLQIINARGLGISGPEGIKRVQRKVEDFHPEVIMFDPLYKIASGVENAAEDVKTTMGSIDKLAEHTGAAVGLVHHDPKGSPGDRDIRDRGAGSNVLGRDYDACITLTAHSQDPEAAVVEVLLRNYPPQEPFTIAWTESEDGGYRFDTCPDMVPEKKTSKTRPVLPSLETYLPAAASILGEDEMEVGHFRAAFKAKTGLSDHRIREFVNWATAGGNPYLMTREERGRGFHKRTLKVGKKINEE